MDRSLAVSRCLDVHAVYLYTQCIHTRTRELFFFSFSFYSFHFCCSPLFRTHTHESTNPQQKCNLALAARNHTLNARTHSHTHSHTGQIGARARTHCHMYAHIQRSLIISLIFHSCDFFSSFVSFLLIFLLRSRERARAVALNKMEDIFAGAFFMVDLNFKFKNDFQSCVCASASHRIVERISTEADCTRCIKLVRARFEFGA